MTLHLCPSCTICSSPSQPLQHSAMVLAVSPPPFLTINDHFCASLSKQTLTSMKSGLLNCVCVSWLCQSYIPEPFSGTNVFHMS